jgi:hypothetical protein
LNSWCFESVSLFAYTTDSSKVPPTQQEPALELHTDPQLCGNNNIHSEIRFWVLLLLLCVSARLSARSNTCEAGHTREGVTQQLTAVLIAHIDVNVTFSTVSGWLGRGAGTTDYLRAKYMQQQLRRGRCPIYYASFVMLVLLAASQVSPLS